MWCVESPPSWSVLVKKRGACAEEEDVASWQIRRDKDAQIMSCERSFMGGPQALCGGAHLSQCDCSGVHRREESSATVVVCSGVKRPDARSRRLLYGRDFVCILSEDFRPAEGRMEVLSVQRGLREPEVPGRA